MAFEEGMAINHMAPVNENPAPVDEVAAAMEPAEMEHHLSDSFQNNSKIFTEDGFNEEFSADINGVEIDRTAELKQDFEFSKQDLSMILDKFMMGDVRIIQNDDSGSPFERISTVNNYPGEGSRSQGTVENVFAIYGADNSPTAVEGFIQSVGSNGEPLPNNRQVSNTIGAQGDDFMPEEAGFNNLYMGVGQYIDHGLDSIPKQEGVDADQMTIFLPKNDPLRREAFDEMGRSVTQLSLLNAAEPIDGTAVPGEAEYQNSKTPVFDQDQTYGATTAISDFLREKDEQGNYTSRLLDSSLSSANELRFFREYISSVVGIPTFYDVIINSAHKLGYLSQEELQQKIDHLLDNNVLQRADKVVR